MDAPLSLGCSAASFSRGLAGPPVSVLACCLDTQLMCCFPLCFDLEEYHKKKAVNHLRENLQYMLKGRLVANRAVTEKVRWLLLFGGLLLLRNTGEWGSFPDLPA